MLPDLFDLPPRAEVVDHHARLAGLRAMLALPEVRDVGGPRKRDVEIEVAPGEWQAVSMCVVMGRVGEAPEAAFSFGSNGSTRCWRFALDAIPRWRVDHGRERVAVPHQASS